ncbi:MAG: exonuclease domain-containing protein [Planctomycetia bacterium]|nr:exonuclease domain-containing protein [Planctomycetia bacterium]
MDCVALDLENIIYSNNNQTYRIPCAYAMVKYQANQRTSTCFGLIQPPENYYDEHTIQYHHINPSMTKDIPFFPDCWDLIKYFVGDLPVIAHFFGFSERNILTDATQFYHLDLPNWLQCGCTGEMAMKLEDENQSKGLFSLAKKYNLPLNHHNALSDAEACLQLALRYQTQFNAKEWAKFFKPFQEYAYTELPS